MSVEVILSHKNQNKQPARPISAKPFKVGIMHPLLGTGYEHRPDSNSEKKLN